MTERQPSDELLNDLLHSSDIQPTAAPFADRRVLSDSDAQRLMREARRAGTPTLTPAEATTGMPESDSFASEVAAFVRRHPMPTMLAAAALAYLLTRRRR